MPNRLKVVILEDRWQDADLMARALEEAGYEIECERVDTESGFLSAISTAPDIILADYQLPEYNAMNALDALHERELDVPFIVVTGALGDEFAAACIRAGATDYILKDRLARLGIAVARALQQVELRAERQAILDALQRSERRFRSVFEDSPTGMAILGADGTMIEANLALREMLQLPPAEPLSGTILDHLHPEDAVPVSGALESTVQPLGAHPRLRCRFQRAEGRVTWAELSLSALSASASSGTGVLAMVEDITERIRSDEFARRRDAILSAVGQAAETFLTADDWDYAVSEFLALVTAAASVEHTTIWCRREGDVFDIVGRCPPLAERNGTEPPLAPECPGVGGAEEQTRARLQAGDPVVVEVLPGSERRSASALIPISAKQAWWGHIELQSGDPQREWTDVELDALRTAADLFGDALQDRESAEALRASEERTRLIVDTALDAVISVDGSGLITGWNPRAEEVFGWPANDAIGLPFVTTIAPTPLPADWDEVRAWLDAGSPSGTHHRHEVTARHRDGPEFAAEIAIASARTNGTVMYSVFLRDITEQKAAQQTIEHARAQEDWVAARIQEALLIGDPPITTPRLSIATETVPGKVIAGDFVASIRHDEDTVDVVIGDVMGKGVNAALLGAITKGNIHQATRRLMLWLADLRRLPEPHEIVAAVHEHMTRELAEIESFVTLCYARFDLSRWRCAIVDCGHTRTVHYRRETGECRLIKGENLPLGITGRELFMPIYVRFQPGDRFFFYSDGVIEAEAPDEEMFGEERVVRAVNDTHDLSPKAMVARIRKDVMTFCSGAPPADDLTCVAVAIGDSAPARADIRHIVEVPGDLDQLEPVREFVRAFCNDMPGPPLNPEALDALMLAAHEAACNVIMHAHQHRSDMRVQVMGEAFPDHVELRFYDLGVGFALSGVPTPATDGSQPSGYGIFLIRQLVDEVTYSRDELGRNYLCLRKLRHLAV